MSDDPREPTWRVMRQDDNGNRCVMRRATSRAEAEAIVVEFENRGHKQMYWVEEDPAKTECSRR